MPSYKLTFGDRALYHNTFDNYLCFGKPPIKRYEYSSDTSSFNYNKSYTSNVTGVNHYIAGNMAVTSTGGYIYGATAKYIANNTNGTWTATGYAP